MGKILQGSHFVLCQSALPPDMQHRAFRSKRGGDSSHRVGATRTGCCNNASQTTGLPGIPIGRMSCYLLVAYINDSNVLVQTPIVDIDDMPPTKGENRIDALCLERLVDKMPTRN